MRDVNTPVKHHQPAAAAHGRHDRLLVTRYAADDSYPAEGEEARALVDSCHDCAALVDEIRMLRAATAALPAPGRPRDFRLTVEQAERLRGSALERFLRRLAAPGLAPVRPLAGVALAIGLVLTVTSFALPTPTDLTDMRFGAPAAQQEIDPMSRPEMEEPDYAPAPGVGPRGDQAGAEASPPAGSGAADAEGRALTLDVADDPARTALLYGGLAIALLSLGVLAVTIFARRRASDPLLR